MEKIPHYYMEISEDDVSGVNAVALVDAPAIMIDFFKFNQQNRHTFIANEERRLVMGALMVAGLPIYRNDPQRGEYYVTFTAKTIEKIVKRFMKNAYTSNVNLMHIPALKADGVYMIESFMIDENRGIKTPEGYPELTEGSWMGTFYVENPEIWEKIKSGEFKGFSVEGFFDLVEDKPQPEEDLIKQIEDILNY